MGLIRNINDWTRKSKKAREAIKSKATSYVRRRVLHVYKDALMVSPQWSGNYVYNWRIEITGYTGGGHMTRFKVNPWQKLAGDRGARMPGHPEAINAALANAKEIIDQISWNSKIGLVNYAPVADMIEAGTAGSPTRSENRGLRYQIPGNVGVLAYLKMKYKYV